MNRVTVFLLRAKAWQIFALIIGLGVSGQIVATISLIRGMESPDGSLKVPLGFGIETVLMMCCFLGWHWSIGTFLSSRVPSALRLKPGFFRFALVYPAIYVMCFIWMFKFLNGLLFSLILLLHFLAMYCLFYLLYFVSKSLVMAETCKPASFNDYAGPFFSIWFLPFGIWFIQPRINRQYMESLPASGKT
jgi:hypothetical protein